MKNKKLLLGFFIASLLLGCFLQREKFDVVRKVPKLNYETPPGCVWLHDNVFMDETEITNLEYLEFIYWTKRLEPEKLDSILPDTLVWRDSLSYNEPYVLYYLRHPAYYNFPVVGISYEQAVAFCEWRSKMVNRFIYIRENEKQLPKHYDWDTLNTFPTIMHFRLPTKEEWELASAAGLDYSFYPLGYEKITDKNNILVSNTRENGYLYNNNKRNEQEIKKLMQYHSNIDGGVAGYINDASDITTPVSSGKKNKFGIYNLLGNVSEIIADSLFKGLNWETSLDGSTFKLKKENYQIVDSTSNGYDYKYTFRYQKPQAWLGFRCVCDVLQQKK